MLTMDQIHHIRALYYEQGYNISEIARATDRDWKTLAKYIDITDFNEPQPAPPRRTDADPPHSIQKSPRLPPILQLLHVLFLQKLVQKDIIAQDHTHGI